MANKMNSIPSYGRNLKQHFENAHFFTFSSLKEEMSETTFYFI